MVDPSDEAHWRGDELFSRGDWGGGLSPAELTGLGAFLRGQLLVMIALATLYSAGLSIVGLQFADVDSEGGPAKVMCTPVGHATTGIVDV